MRSRSKRFPWSELRKWARKHEIDIPRPKSHIPTPAGHAIFAELFSQIPEHDSATKELRVIEGTYRRGGRLAYLRSKL